MGLLKFMIVGAAVAYGISEITKKRADGTSILDNLSEHGPEWAGKAKRFAEDTVGQVKETVRQARSETTI